MRPATYVFLSALVVMGACRSSGTEYRLTADQQGWQPYQEGQTLRFGNATTGDIRTYQVTKVSEYMREYGGFYLDLTRQRPKYQQLLASIKQLGPSMDYFDGMSTELYAAPPPLLEVAASWGTSTRTTLPNDAIDRGLPIDTSSSSSYQGIALLRNLRLGPTTYAQVVRVRDTYGNSTVPRFYFVKGQGVVGFVEYGRPVLWYRLP